jgi:hypothetical protein
MSRIAAWAVPLALWVAGAPAIAHAEPIGIVTILEGSAFVLRGAARLVVAEGVRVEAGDIIQTADASVMQLELADQSIAQLGPSARVMLAAQTRPKPERTLYVLNGWIKVIATQRDPKAGVPVEIRAPLFELAPGNAVTVFKSSPAEVALFVETGAARIVERVAGARGPETPLKQGSFYQRKAATKSAIGTALPQEFIAEMPRIFRDSLPARRDRFADREIAAKAGPDFTYAEVEGWLKSEPAVRRQFVQRWRAKAGSDNAFRGALVANLPAHPEWDPVLFPEKYLPKPPPEPRPAVSASPSERINEPGAAR